MTMLSMPVLNVMLWVTGMLGQATPGVNSRPKKMRVWTLLLTMGTALTIAASPSQASIVAGPITNPANGHSYYLLSNSSWTASEAEAVTLGGHLATIRSAAENDWVYTTFSSYSGRWRDLWVGLNDLGTPGTFVWVSGDSSTYRNWNTGEPNQIGTERYVYIYGPASAAPRRWNNAPSTTSTPYGVVEVIRPLSSLAITGGPSTVYAASMASYTATATFDDSTTAVVTPTWSVNPTTYVGIDVGGILTAGWVPSDQTITVTADFAINGVTKTDSKTVTIIKQRETGTRYFSDDFETGLDKWEVSGADWAIIASGCRSGANCITDSPSGNYPPNANSVISMQLPVNLSGSTSPILSFWHKCFLASGDNGYVEISTNGGLSWAAVPGGSFSGAVSTWTNQLLDLTAYKGPSVLLRFRLRDYSGTVQWDGWYIDDVKLYEGGVTPVITWANPASIVYGTALSGTQLNATATVGGVTLPGTFLYTPPAGTVLAVGTHTLSVTFTPTDTVHYTTATATVTIDVTAWIGGTDFTGDLKSDILWRHATRGEVWLWPMDGASRMAETHVRTVSDTDFEIRGVGDQNGDGKADILWRNKSNGQVYFWPMNGSTPLSETYVATVDPAYDIVGTGDYNGDGKSDILWRHLTNGGVWIWLMNGATPLSQVYVDTVPDAGYAVVGSGDLNGDTKADIVWHHGTRGDVWVWLMNGTTRTSQTYIGTVPDVGYQIVGVADHTRDGKADILWRHATRGEVWIWPMNGTTVVSETYVDTVPDTGYQIVGSGDYNGDGKADILWHHATRGEVWVWLMNGTTKLSETWVATVPELGYQIIKVK